MMCADVHDGALLMMRADAHDAAQLYSLRRVILRCSDIASQLYCLRADGVGDITFHNVKNMALITPSFWT